MQWDAPSFPAVLGILHSFLPNADVRVDFEPGEDVTVSLCLMRHVHVSAGIMAPYMHVVLGIAKAYGVAMHVHAPGMELERALELVWSAVSPALGFTADPFRDAFFDAPSPQGEQLH